MKRPLAAAKGPLRDAVLTPAPVSPALGSSQGEAPSESVPSVIPAASEFRFTGEISAYPGRPLPIRMDGPCPPPRTEGAARSRAAYLSRLWRMPVTLWEGDRIVATYEGGKAR